VEQVPGRWLTVDSDGRRPPCRRYDGIVCAAVLDRRKLVHIPSDAYQTNVERRLIGQLDPCELGTRVSTTCPRFSPESGTAGIRTHDLLCPHLIKSVYNNMTLLNVRRDIICCCNCFADTGDGCCIVLNFRYFKRMTGFLLLVEESLVRPAHIGCVCVETFTATSSGDCEQLAITWLCRVAFRPCNDRDLDLVTLRPLCRHQCDILQGRRCRRVFSLAKRLLLNG